MLDINQIIRILPHRYPMLLVDRIVEMEQDRIVGLKNVTINEPFFAGHFPAAPVMPGVLICEALAQAGALLAYCSKSGVAATKQVLLAGLDHVRFRRPVVPGDQLRLEVVLVKHRFPLMRMRGTAMVDGQTAAEAEIIAMVVQSKAQE